MSYASIVAGMHERFSTVSAIKVVLSYEPNAIHEAPTMYTLADLVTYSQEGQIQVTRYRILHRLVIARIETEASENELIPFVDSVPAAVEADPQLGGRITRGYARIADLQATFVTIGGVLYRSLDFYSDVVVKRAISRS